MASRIVVILHPNTSFIEFILNDRMYNKEQYTHTRENMAVGPEAVMLRVLNFCTNGVVKAEPSRNKMRVEIEDGFFLNEIVPVIITSIMEFVGEKDYKPEIFVDDNRWIVEPVYAESSDEWSMGREIAPGVKAKRGDVDIGIPYTVWKQ